MAILYDWYENPKPDSQGETTLHPRPCFNGSISTATLVEYIRERCTLTPGDIKAVLMELNEVVGAQLREGRRVHIEGLGYLFPTLEADGKVTPDMKMQKRSALVRFKGISFRMDKELSLSVGSPRLTRVAAKNSSKPRSEAQVERLLTDYFKEHRTITRSQYQYFMGVSRTSACQQLKHLHEQGKLMKEGELHFPVYYPAPGCFGRAAE